MKLYYFVYCILSMLNITNLKASIWNKTILNWVNLKVWYWELHVILWPNWSGKSTLWKVIMANQKYNIEWDIIFEWENIIWLKTYEIAKKWIFLSHQHPINIEWVSTFEVLRTAQKQTWEHISLFKFKNQLKEIFKTYQIKEEFLDRDFNKWASWWEMKKIEIATLLSLNNKFAFLDEIDSWLDFDAMKIIALWINKFLEWNNKSILIVTHSKQILEYLNPNFVHIFHEWRIIKTWSKDLIREIHEKWYKAFLSTI